MFYRLSATAPEGHWGTRPQYPSQYLKRARCPQTTRSMKLPPQFARASFNACQRSPGDELVATAWSGAGGFAAPRSAVAAWSV
ncbi:MAG: hypothetical protein WCB48_08355, partial [Casimicrobiaceae bacterium]